LARFSRPSRRVVPGKRLKRSTQQGAFRSGKTSFSAFLESDFGPFGDPYVLFDSSVPRAAQEKGGL
jgi:hypothetical protein